LFRVLVFLALLKVLAALPGLQIALSKLYGVVIVFLLVEKRVDDEIDEIEDDGEEENESEGNEVLVVAITEVFV